MGTRHLILLYHSGRIVVAQYGGHDGYPSYAGHQMMDDLSNARYIRRLRTNISLFHHLEPNIDYRDWNASYIDESAGLEVLDNIAYAEAGKPILHSFLLDFADEGGMCEWCYLIDLDVDVLEIYYGVRMDSRRGARPVLRGRLVEAGVTQ
jgi:hypothetical protein